VTPTRAEIHGFNEIRLQAESGGLGHEALSDIFENVPLAIAVTLGPEHRYAFANRLFRSALSISGSLSGKTLREALGERYTPETQAIRQYVLETGTPCEIAGVSMSSASGQEDTFWDIRFLPVRDADGRVSGILTIGADVTERITASRAAERQAQESEINSRRLSLAVAATELGFWDWDAATERIYWSDRQREIFGVGKDKPITHDLWISAIHPEDRAWVVERVTSLLHPASSGKLQIEYRILRPDGGVRWISSRGKMLFEFTDGEMKAARLLGTILDITERRQNEEARKLLAHELNHRVKNLFAMASAMVSLTARTAASPEAMATALHGRLQALARAHELIRPAVTGTRPIEGETSTLEIIETILAPHNAPDLPQRIFIECPPIPVSAPATTSLTLVLHELATNALKYGALSAADGCLRIVCRHDDDVVLLVWQELNGPALEGAPTSKGFGSQLARKSVTDQLGGEITYDWRREGLHVAIRLPAAQLAC
jgi:PAS domain S-box-containing protein